MILFTKSIKNKFPNALVDLDERFDADEQELAPALAASNALLARINATHMSTGAGAF